MNVNKKQQRMLWRKVLSTESVGRHLHNVPFESDDMKLPSWQTYYENCFDAELESIVHSDAFRRPENKTQVFAFGGSGKVRTRLTHSIEGRSIKEAHILTKQRQEEGH